MNHSGRGVPHLSHRRIAILSTPGAMCFMRVIRDEIILATRFRIAVVIRRARDPSFISATPFDTDGSTGGLVRRDAVRCGTTHSGSDYAFARNARLNDGPQG